MREDKVSEEKRQVFYAVNADNTQSRTIVGDSQEVVEFHDDTGIRIWYNDLTVHYPAHWHTAIEIILPMENYYETVIQDQMFHLEPGDIMIIPPREIHSIIAPETGNRFIFMIDMTSIAGIHGFATVSSVIARPLHITKQDFPYIYDDIYQILIQMRNEYFNQNEFAELSIFSLLINLLVKLGTNHIESLPIFNGMRVYKQKEYVQKFNDVMDYIDTHYMEELDLNEIASSIGFSKYHFSRLFKQYTNYTFCNYISHRRVQAAEELLAQPDLSITEIALQSGFPSISTFNRIFRQYKSCTPSEYRNKNNQYDVSSYKR